MLPSSRAGWASRAWRGARTSRSTSPRGTVRIGEHELRAGDVITDRRRHGTRHRAVPSRSFRRRSTRTSGRSSSWADDVRRLRVRANADTPEDAAKAREFGAEGIGLCRTEHMFMGEERLPVVREMILARDEEERRAALDRLLPMQQGDFEGIFEAMAGLAGDDPAARPAAARVPAAARGGDLRRDARPDPPAPRGEPDARARAAAGSACSSPRSTRCRFARSSARRAPSKSGRARRRSSRSCIRSSASRRSSPGCASSPSGWRRRSRRSSTSAGR